MEGRRGASRCRVQAAPKCINLMRMAERDARHARWLSSPGDEGLLRRWEVRLAARAVGRSHRARIVQACWCEGKSAAAGDHRRFERFAAGTDSLASRALIMLTRRRCSAFLSNPMAMSSLPCRPADDADPADNADLPTMLIR